MAWFRRRPALSLIHHSACGSHYASGVFQTTLTDCGMICAMSWKDNCWDNALADLFDYIEIFDNLSHCHCALDYYSPVRFLQDWITNQHERKMAV